MLNKFLSTVWSYFPWNNSPPTSIKRGRESISGDGLDSDVPAKRLKLIKPISVLVELNQPKVPVKQPFWNTEIIDLTQPLSKPSRISSSKSCRSMKENFLGTPRPLQVEELSPIKLKNKYKAPRHIRSPNKIRTKFFTTTLNESTVSETVDLTGSHSSFNPLDRTGSNSYKRMNSVGMAASPSQAERSYEALTRDEYSKLLGTYINKQSKLRTMEQGRQTLSLLDNMEASGKSASKTKKTYPIIDLTSANKYDSTNHHTIVINDDDEVELIKTPKVPPVNSFEEKLRMHKSTTITLIEAMSKKYAESRAEFENTKSKYEQMCKRYSDSNRKKIDEMLEQRLREHLRITEVILDSTIEQPLPELTPAMQEQIDAAFIPKPGAEVLINKFNYRITRADLNCLTGLCWLNDEIINFYMELIMERGKTKDFPDVHTFNTFFYQKISSSGHSGVKRWTRKVDIFKSELILVPIHLQVHWCMAVIDLPKKTISYYDSMGSQNLLCLRRLKEYLECEHKDKKGSTFETSDWTLQNIEKIPQQKNGSDCGVFACTFAEFLSRKADLNFSQKDMKYFRRKMAYEIIKGKLL